jgi:hypothetical protein
MPSHQENWGGFCRQCQKPSRFIRTVETPNHILHFLIALISCGLWIPFWMVIAAYNKTSGWYCSQCGWVHPS